MSGLFRKMKSSLLPSRPGLGHSLRAAVHVQLEVLDEAGGQAVIPIPVLVPVAPGALGHQDVFRNVRAGQETSKPKSWSLRYSMPVSLPGFSPATEQETPSRSITRAFLRQEYSTSPFRLREQPGVLSPANVSAPPVPGSCSGQGPPVDLCW